MFHRPAGMSDGESDDEDYGVRAVPNNESAQVSIWVSPHVKFFHHYNKWFAAVNSK